MSHTLANLESLPPEVIILVLQDLPVSDILSVCGSSNYLSSFCQDWDLWAEKASHEFNFPRDQFTQTYLRVPIQRYQQIRAYHNRPGMFLIRAARSGNLQVIEYLLDIGADDARPTIDARQILDAIDVAAETGNVAVLRRLLEAFDLPQPDAEGNYDEEKLDEWLEWAQNGALFFDNLDELLDYALRLAARHNHVEAVQELIEAGAHDYGFALAEAGLGGYTDIVELLLHHTPPNRRVQYLNDLLIGAAAGGHVNLVNEAIQAGATNLNAALATAVENGRIEMIDYLRQRGAQDLNRALLEAAHYNQVAAIQHLIDAGANNLDDALASAAYYGHLEAVKELLQRGATDLNEALESSTSGHNLDVVKTLIQAGATNLNQALKSAARIGDLPIIQELIQAGATNIREAARVALRSPLASPEVDKYFESLLNTS
jgi:ankyrin repeat protein